MLWDLAGCGPPGRSRREPEQMEEGFRWCLVLCGSGGERALLIHCYHLQDLNWSERLDKGKRFTKVSNDFLKAVAFRVPDTSFHHISVVGEER